jgi:hypothetical protein
VGTVCPAYPPIQTEGSDDDGEDDDGDTDDDGEDGEDDDDGCSTPSKKKPASATGI